MQYARYGKDGPMISRLGFGLMRLPVHDKTDEGTVNFRRSTRLMRTAMGEGVNFFDSHHNYHHGNSEVALGKALKGWTGQRIYIQTKTPWYLSEPISYFKRRLEEALEKLGVDSIDYLLTHMINRKTWKRRGKSFIRFSDWALKQGLIRHRGFSSHETPENVKEFIDTGEFSAMVLSYNWMDPRRRDVIAYGASKGMGVSIMNPVGGGALAIPTPQIMRLLRGAKSAAEVGFRYVLATPGVTTALSGMNALEQVSENVRIADRKKLMTSKQKKYMQTRLADIKRQADRFCTACGYCMPCPHGVDIPANFQLYNRVKFFGQLEFAKRRYKMLKSGRWGNRSAEACKRCGKCLPKCPNDVPIIDQLQKVAEMLG